MAAKVSRSRRCTGRSEFLGVIYAKGSGVPRDYAEAMKWYRKAADQGNALGEANLGALYYRGEGVRQDYAEAATWYRKAADQGNAQGEAGLGSLYVAGHGVSDYAEAQKWLRKAADQDEPGAETNLGLMYAKGAAVRPDLCKQASGSERPQNKVSLPDKQVSA